MIHALVIALLLVLIVIYLFLGTVRATLIPAVTIPVSIISASIVMVIAGFSINVLTLLGAVLAIGLVVDDAIVVLENIVRRIELGQPPLLAAVDGSREIGFAVIATTLVLIAVFLPISFIPGNIGRLFGEFGITIAAAIGFSALVSLTLVPMMSSKIFGHGIVRGRVAHAVDRFFKWLSQTYERSLRSGLHAPGADRRRRRCRHRARRGPVPAAAVPSTRRPKTASASIIMLTAPEGSSLQYMERYLKQVEQIAMAEVEKGNARRILSRIGNFGGGGDVNVGRVVLSLSDFDERKESAQQIAARLRPMLQNLAGVRATVVHAGRPGHSRLRCAGAGRARRRRLRGAGALARHHPGEGGGESRADESRFRLLRAQAAAEGVRGSQPRRRPRRVADRRRPHARNDDGLAHRHDVPRSRRGIQRDAAGPRQRPRDAERPDEYLRALVHHRLADPAVESGARRGDSPARPS